MQLEPPSPAAVFPADLLHGGVESKVRAQTKVVDIALKILFDLLGGTE